MQFSVILRITFFGVGSDPSTGEEIQRILSPANRTYISFDVTFFENENTFDTPKHIYKKKYMWLVFVYRYLQWISDITQHVMFYKCFKDYLICYCQVMTDLSYFTLSHEHIHRITHLLWKHTHSHTRHIHTLRKHKQTFTHTLLQIKRSRILTSACKVT